MRQEIEIEHKMVSQVRAGGIKRQETNLRRFRVLYLGTSCVIRNEIHF